MLIIYLLMYLSFDVIKSASIPVSNNITSQLPTTNLTLGMPTDKYLHCDDMRHGLSLLATDCEAALTLLPDDEPGDIWFDENLQRYVYPQFNRLTAEDRHRLPITARFLTCMVHVQLVANVEADHSSWRIIKMRATNVIRECVDMVEGSVGTGGYVFTGEGRGIAVIIQSSAGRVITLGYGNSTTS